MIRPYRVDDLEQVLEVWQSASAVGHPFLSEDVLASERESIVRDHLPSAEVWVWEAERRVAGFIALLGDEVGAIFVDPALHGTGVGRALMDHARELRERLEVEVFAANTVGRRFYARYGFVETDQAIHAPTGLNLIRMELAATRGRSSSGRRE